MDTKLFKSFTPLPHIPNNTTKYSVINSIKEYATKNSFEIVIARSTSTSAHLKCKKGSKYKNVRKLTEEDRKSWRNSCRTEHPFLIRIGDKKGEGLVYLSPVFENEHYHNHEIKEENMLSTSTRRKHLLTTCNIEELKRGIEQKVPSKTIQEILSSESNHNKLTVHDINNLRYTMTNRVDIRSNDGAFKLIRHVEISGFIVEYRCDPISENLNGLFFSNLSLRQSKEIP